MCWFRMYISARDGSKSDTIEERSDEIVVPDALEQSSNALSADYLLGCVEDALVDAWGSRDSSSDEIQGVNGGDADHAAYGVGGEGGESGLPEGVFDGLFGWASDSERYCVLRNDSNHVHPVSPPKSQYTFLLDHPWRANKWRAKRAMLVNNNEVGVLRAGEAKLRSVASELERHILVARTTMRPRRFAPCRRSHLSKLARSNCCTSHRQRSSAF